MTTRCKFQCQAVKKQTANLPSGPGFTYEAEFYAVYSGSEENKQFFAFTPAGSLKLSTYREDIFTPGHLYYLDISEAPA
jgi:hypothetical protein